MSFSSLCSDSYVNQKLAVKLDLPRGRETMLDMFERVRREFPSMQSFRRYSDELALESPTSDTPHRWLALRTNTLRSGVVNSAELSEAYALHRHVLEVAPFYLSISPLDVEHMELLYGFDLECQADHDEVVHRALFAGTRLGVMGDMPGATPIDCQPVIGIRLDSSALIEAHLEVKTRSAGESKVGGGTTETISVYVILRSHAPLSDITRLVPVFEKLKRYGEDLVESRVVPEIIVPLRREITG